MVSYRRIRPEDVESVLGLWREYCSEALENCPEDMEPEDEGRMFELAVAHENGFCLLAEHDGAPVGFILASAVPHPLMGRVRAEIEAIYVRPDQRRRKIGSRLLEQALAVLQGKGARAVRAQGRIETPAARTFWQRLGWRNDFHSFSHYPK